jgi:hypothetical protein
MAKMIAATLLSIASVGAIETELGKSAPLNGFPGEPDSFRNLLLNALGTRPVEPGQVRIPIPTDGAVYEVVIPKPGEARFVPIASDDADQPAR